MSRFLFEYSFSLGAPAAAAGSTATLGTPATRFGAPTDMYIDPVTLDYVRTDNGEWLETADSRTAVMIMLEIELGASPFDPQDGTQLAALRRRGDPITPELIQGDTQRAMGILVRDGILTDLQVDVRDRDNNVMYDQAGRTLTVLHWRDLASGSPVDATLIGR